MSVAINIRCELTSYFDNWNMCSNQLEFDENKDPQILNSLCTQRKGSICLVCRSPSDWWIFHIITTKLSEFFGIGLFILFLIEVVCFGIFAEHFFSPISSSINQKCNQQKSLHCVSRMQWARKLIITIVWLFLIYHKENWRNRWTSPNVPEITNLAFNIRIG